MAPTVTLRHSLLEIEGSLPQRPHVCSNPDYDGQVRQALRQHLPGKLFHKRKIPRLLTEAFNKATTVIIANMSQIGPDDQSEATDELRIT